MSTYLSMWDAIKQMSHERAAFKVAWRGPPKGRSVCFQGVHVLDVDLIEALRNYTEDT